MKYHIDTIPLWDAYKSGCACPLCQIEHLLEADYLDRAMGGAVMDPSHRIRSNEKGLCAKHFKALYSFNTHLPLALMSHTHLQTVMNSAQPVMQKLSSIDDTKRSAAKQRAKYAEELLKQLHNVNSACIVCEDVDVQMLRYAQGVTALYKNEQPFREAFAASNGFCLPHFEMVLKASLEHLSGSVGDDFRRDLCRAQQRSLEALEGDIKWYTEKFNYLNADKPWGTAKDAVPRTLNKLAGDIIEQK